LKKAKQGNAESQYTLGTLYELGGGVAEDDKEAWIEIRRSINVSNMSDCCRSKNLNECIF